MRYFYKVNLSLKEGISIVADSGPLGYIRMYFNAEVVEVQKHFFSIGSSHTVFTVLFSKQNECIKLNENDKS